MGYIKLSRKITEWEWYSDKNTCRLFIHMLLKANWNDGRFRGTEVKRGSFVSSTKQLSEETKLSEQEVKTAIKHLKSTSEITSKATNKFTVYTVNNYDMYQSYNQQSNDQATNEQLTSNQETTNGQPSINHQSTTIEEYKESKKEKKEEGKKEKNNTVRFVPPSVEEVADYCQERGNGIDANAFVDFYKANGWVQGKGKPVQDWKACVRTWERNRRDGGKRADRSTGSGDPFRDMLKGGVFDD